MLKPVTAMLITLLGPIAVPAIAAQEGDREIVVTGQSLKTTEKAFRDCIARGCPPDEEIRAALTHAENQFITGDYRDARSILGKTVGRNRKHGGEYPIEVSDLFRAFSRIAEHFGEGDLFRLSVLDMRDTLREALPENDGRLIVAQIEVGPSWSKLGYPKEAVRVYANVAAKALAAGHTRWAKLVFDAIASRIYAPLKAQEGGTAPGFYMVERCSMKAQHMDEVTGTRIGQRSPETRIERIDITPENYDQPFVAPAKSDANAAS